MDRLNHLQNIQTLLFAYFHENKFNLNISAFQEDGKSFICMPAFIVHWAYMAEMIICWRNLRKKLGVHQ